MMGLKDRSLWLENDKKRISLISNIIIEICIPRTHLDREAKEIKLLLRGSETPLSQKDEF